MFYFLECSQGTCYSLSEPAPNLSKKAELSSSIHLYKCACYMALDSHISSEVLHLLVIMSLQLCHSEDGDGCGGHFVNKKTPGLCAKCSKLASLSDKPSELEKWKAYPQCRKCGVAWKNLVSPACGACTILTPSGLARPSSTGDVNANGHRDGASDALTVEQLQATAVESSRVARAHAMDVRLNKHTNPTIAIAKANSVSCNESKILVTIECRVKSLSKRDQKQMDPSLGKWAKPWSKDTYLSEVLDDALATVNTSWEKTESMNLLRDEVEFRWSGNKVFHPGTQNETIGTAFKEYMTGDMALFYVNKSSSNHKGRKNQPEMALELYIDKVAFMDRHDALREADLTSALGSRKRSGTISMITREAITKRPTLSVMPSFVRSSMPRSSYGSDNTSTKIRFVKSHTTCDPYTGAISVTWVTDDPDQFEGILGDREDQKGLHALY